MCCFLAPATTVIVTTIVKKRVPEKYHVEWLNSMLWGGVVMLIVEHIAHREVVPYFPFFTAGWSEMWPEIIRVGIPMTIIVFLAWILMVWVSEYIQNKKLVSSES
jgi:hypothetical protein